MQAKISDISYIFTLINANDSFQQNSSSRMRKSASVRNVRIHANQNLQLRQSMRYKKPKIQYQVMDGKIIKVYGRQSSIKSYSFDKILQQKSQLIRTANFLIEQDIGNKLIIAHNYHLADCKFLIKNTMKQLTNEGKQYKIILNLKQQLQKQLQNTHKFCRMASQGRIDRNYHSIPSVIYRNIKNKQQMKEFINQLDKIVLQIQTAWILNKSEQFGVSFIKNKSKQHRIYCIDELLYEHDLYKSKGLIQNIENQQKFKVIVSTICQLSSKNNYQLLNGILQQAIELRTLFKSKNNPLPELFSFRENLQTALEPRSNNFHQDTTLKSQSEALVNSLQFNRNYDKTRKNSKNSLKIRNGTQKFKKYNKNQYMNDKSSSQNSESESSLFQQSTKQLKKQKKIDNSNKQNNLANIMAENMNLKWQIQAIQKQYEHQSQKYTNKMNKKIESLKEEKFHYYEQNKKLKQQNDILLLQLGDLREKYQSVLLSLNQNEKIMKEQCVTMKEATQKNFKSTINQKQEEIKRLSQSNSNLQNQLAELRILLEDNRKRSRDRVQELQQEIEQYKKFCEEIKVAYDDLKSQLRMDKDRNQNLEKRCKKYQESFANLIKIKSESSVRTSQRSSIISSDKEEGIKNIDEPEKFISERLFDIKKRDKSKKLEEQITQRKLKKEFNRKESFKNIKEKAIQTKK